MKINKVKIINFKKFEEEKLFEFKDSNNISGYNGSGKSTIKDAIIFCFYNRTSEGSSTESNKYISNGKVKCLVEVEFEKDGITHTVKRERTDKQTRITYCDNSQSEDDSIITQRELDSIIPSYEVFQAVFNIGYFMRLSDNEKREFILSLTPSIDKSEIYYELGGKDEWLFGTDFNNIEGNHKKFLKEKKENDDELIRINALLKDSVKIELTKNPYEDKSKEIAEMKVAIENSRKIDALWETRSLKMRDNEEIIKNNDTILKEIDQIKILEIEKPSREIINNLTNKKNELSKTINLPEGKCPLCLQDILPEHKDKIDEANNKVAVETRKLQEEIDKEEFIFLSKEKEYNENENNKNRINVLSAKIRNIYPLENIPEKINVDYDQFRKLEEEQQKYLSEKSKIELLKKQEEERVLKVDKLKSTISSIRTENDMYTQLISIFSPKGIPAREMDIKLKPIIEKFREFIPEANISTLELLKNGLSYKEVFKIFSGNKEYSKMSLGERTKIDIALSQIIDSFLKDKIGIYFLDNSEVIDTVPNISIQNFICKVSTDKLTIN